MREHPKRNLKGVKEAPVLEPLGVLWGLGATSAYRDDTRVTKGLSRGIRFRAPSRGPPFYPIKIQ